MTASDKIRAAFEEVAAFVTRNQRLPAVDAEDFDEQVLAAKFNASLKKNPDGLAYCQSLIKKPEGETQAVAAGQASPAPEITAAASAQPECESSRMERKAYTSFDDVLNDDPFGLLSDVGDVAVEREHWKKDTSSTIAGSAEATKAVQCRDFYRYQRYFDEANRLLKSGSLKFKEIAGDSAAVNQGDIFVVNGMMSIIAAAYDETTEYAKSATKIRYRVRQIHANGTESRPYSTSVKNTFYAGRIPAKRVIAADQAGVKFFEGMRAELEKIKKGSRNVKTGYIYILASESTNPVIRKFAAASNLVKIGYCTTEVADRIANAANEPTYLCAPVKVIKTYPCYNFDPRNLEDVLHTMLARHRLNVELKDKGGHSFKPREWFTVSPKTADEIVRHLFDMDLNDYYVDSIQGKLRKKENSKDE